MEFHRNIRVNYYHTVTKIVNVGLNRCVMDKAQLLVFDTMQNQR